MQCFFWQPSRSRGGGSERECWGGSVTVTSIRLCVLSAKWKQDGGGRECWGGSVSVTSIRLCVLSAKWKQEGARKGILGWECNCY